MSEHTAENDVPVCPHCSGLGQVYDGPHIVWRPCPFCVTPPEVGQS